jgi:DNA-binding MarR family transcriptional regulator
MVRKKVYNVTEKRLKRFVEINEILRENTAYAEGKFYSDFKDLTLMQVHVLRIINYHKPCTMGQIAKSADLTMGSVTQILDRLIAKKYVKRIRSKQDRRIVYAELSAKGKKVIESSKGHVSLVGKNLLAKFPEKDQEQFLKFFSRMIE